MEGRLIRFVLNKIDESNHIPFVAACGFVLQQNLFELKSHLGQSNFSCNYLLPQQTSKHPKISHFSVNRVHKAVILLISRRRVSVNMSSGFVTEKEIEEQKKKRQEEWEKVRKADDPKGKCAQIIFLL